MRTQIKLEENSDVLIKDIVRYRFSNGSLGAGQEGKVVIVNEKQSCVYVEVPELNNVILWYDLSEVDPV